MTLFRESTELNLSKTTIVRAIQLRQTKQMGLADAIIAATALEHNLELWTANTNDFKHITGLKLINPLRNK